jgi:hypothetical protein
VVSSAPTRQLDWDGCANVRDLGGLPTLDGRETRFGRLVRADALDRLTPAGWSALMGHGVRTVIDLREPAERTASVVDRPGELATLELPLDGREEREFWRVWADGPQFGTPLYYRPHVARFPERSARVLAAIADAAPGAVAVHCQGGRDRTGQVAMVLLALVGVTPNAIADDYLLSREQLARLHAARGKQDPAIELDSFLAARGTSARGAVLATLAGLDVEALMLAAGLEPRQVAVLRARALD